MKNRYELRGDVTAIYIPLNGEFIETLIDTEDLPKVRVYPNTWFMNSKKLMYVRGITTKNFKRTTVLIHRLILDNPEGIEIDHINRDPLDNRKCNLRVATRTQNVQNRLVMKSNKLGVKGVRWKEQNQKYEARITVNKKPMYLGLYERLEDATEAARVARSLYMPFSPEATNHQIGDQLLRA